MKDLGGTLIISRNTNVTPVDSHVPSAETIKMAHLILYAGGRCGRFTG